MQREILDRMQFSQQLIQQKSYACRKLIYSIDAQAKYQRSQKNRNWILAYLNQKRGILKGEKSRDKFQTECN